MAKNLLVDWMNKAKENNAINPATNIQSRLANTNTASNVISTPNLPTNTGVNLQAAQQPTQTKLDNLNNQTGIVKLQPRQPSKGEMQRNMNQAFLDRLNGGQQGQSRFIGLQKPYQPNTDLGGNITPEYYQRQAEAQRLEEEKERNKPILNIPTVASEKTEFMSNETNKYADTKKALYDLQGDMYKNNRKLTDEELKQLYPEFNLKELKELQDNLRPVVKKGQGVDDKQISQYFPNLLPQKKEASNAKVEMAEDFDNQLKTAVNRGNKLLGSYNTLSKKGVKYLEDAQEVNEFLNYVKDNYKIPGVVTDYDILNYTRQQIPEINTLMTEMDDLMSAGKSGMTAEDYNTIFENGFDLGEGLSDTANALNNVSSTITNYTKDNSSKWKRQLDNLGLNGSAITNGLNTASEIASIPTTMIGGLAGGTAKFGTALERIAKQQNINEDGSTDWNGVATDVIKGGGGALEVGFNTAFAIPTAIFHAANATELGQEITDDTLGLYQEGIQNILDGSFAQDLGLSKDTYLSKWYNSLDEETKSDLVNELTVATLHKGSKALKEAKLEGEVAIDAITNAFQRGKGGAMFQAWVEKGLADEGGKLTKGARQRIVKEGFNEFKDALKENFRMYNTVLKNRRGDITSNMNTLPDNRTFKEKAQSKINEAKETINNIKEGAKETVNDIKQGVAEGVNKGVDLAKEGINKGVENVKQGVGTVKNKVTTKKSTEVTPVEEETGWSNNKSIVGKATEGIAKAYDATVGKAVDAVSEKGAEIITSTTSPQDKLFQAVSPTLNKLTNKRGNYNQKRQNADRTNELIVEYGHEPTNTAEYYKSLIQTKQDLWENEIQRGLDAHKYTTVDVNEIIKPVREALSDDAKFPLASNRSDLELLEREFNNLLELADKDGNIPLDVLEAIKQQINAKVNYGKNPTAGEVFEKGLREINRQISLIEDRMISELPGEFTKFKKDYGALKDMEEDVLKMMLKSQKKKSGGGLIQNRGRIEGLGKLASKPIEGILQFMLGEALGKAKDVDFLIQKGFSDLKGQYKGKKKNLKVKKKDEGETKAEDTNKPTPKAPTDTPKNKVTNKKESKPKAEKKEPTKKQESKSEIKEAEPKQLETRVENKQPEPKKDNTPTRNVVAKKSAATEYVNETPQNERGQLEEIEAEENLRSNETPQRDMVEETKSEPKAIKDTQNIDELSDTLGLNNFKTNRWKGEKDGVKISINKREDGYTLFLDKGGERGKEEDGMVFNATESGTFHGLSFEELKENINKALTENTLPGLTKYQGNPVYTSSDGKPYIYKREKGKSPVKQFILEDKTEPRVTEKEKQKNVATEKAGVTTKSEPKQEDKSGGNAFGLQKQKGSSRINNFTNVITKIVDKYEGDIQDNSILIEKEPYLPLEITYNPEKKELVVRHPNMGYDDPAIRFTVDENGKLKPTGIKQAFMEQMMGVWNWTPIKETDGLLHTRAVNLEDQFLGERNIDEDTGVMKEEKSESAPKEVRDRTSNANIINNIKSFDDLKDLLKPTKAGAVSDWEYEGELNGVKTRVWNYGDTIFIKYGEGQGPAQARIDMADSDHINQLKELLSEINNDGEILESNRSNPFSPKEEKPETKSDYENAAYTKESSKELGEIKTLDELKDKYGLDTYQDKLNLSKVVGVGNSEIVTDYIYGRMFGTNVIFSKENNITNTRNSLGAVPEYNYRAWVTGAILGGENMPPTMPSAKKYFEGEEPNVVISQLQDYLDLVNGVDVRKTTTEITGKKNAVTAESRKIDNSSITGRFRNLTLNDYKEMQKFQGVEEQLMNGDEEGYIAGKVKSAITNEELPLIPNAEIDELEFYPVDYGAFKKLVDKQGEIEDAERNLMKNNGENLSQQIEDLRYEYDNEMLPNMGIYEVEDVDKAVKLIKKAMEDAHSQFRKDSETIKPLVEKYGRYWEQGKQPTESVDNGKNTNIIGKNNSLTTKNNQNDTNLGRSQEAVGGSNKSDGGELSKDVSSMQSVEGTKAGLQRTSDTNGNGELNTSGKQTDISGNGSTAGSESTRLTVGQQRKINEDSRNILEKHNFSTSRSDYTPEELDTLFKYEGNGGLAKAGDENVKGTRYEFYTPKNAVSALQRGIQKYSDSPINSVEDPTAGKGNMLDGYGENIDKYMYEISPVSGTIAKLRFPEAKVGIGEKDGDFQRRYLNYQGQKAYDTPRDGGHNVDAILLNPPFGKRITIKDEPQIKSLEDYFTKRSIEHDLKDGGMVGLLMPSRWLKAGDSYTKRRLADNTEFVDAYRLPAGVFSYTDVGTDLIILKKKKGANNNLTKVAFYDDNYFIANPDKVLGVEKQRTGRHGMETYIDGDPKVIDTLWQDSDVVPSQMNAITDTTNRAAVTAKKTTVENKPKNLVTNPPKEEAKFTPTEATEKPEAEKKTTTKKTSKNAKQTVSKGNKTDIGTYTVNGNEKAYEYQDATDADGYIDTNKANITPKEVADGVELLNYIDGKIQTDYLYFSGDIYSKLNQLEKDKPQMSETQYKKQKEGLEAILPSKLNVGDITWSPTDKALMGQETDMLYKRRDPELREEVDEKMTIKDAFKKRIKNLGSEQFEGTDTNKWKIMDFVDGKRWSPERITKRYSETDEEFEIRKKAKKAEEEQKKQATKERARTFFNDFIKEQLSPEIQNKITESYNTRLRAVVKPDYKNMPLSVKNMSATFHGKPLKVDPVQIEGINAMLSKGTMLIAHGVGYGKTLEGVVATIASVQKGWTKKPLFIVPKGTREDWIKTIHDLFPNQEIVDLGGLTVDDIKRLKRDLGNDVNNWIKDGQVAIVTHNGFNNQINFKQNTQQNIEGDLRDVMEKADSSAREEDSLNESIQNIAATMNAKKDTKKMKGIKGELSGRYGDSLLEDLDRDLGEMNEEEFVENFVNKAKGTYNLSEEELRLDAHKMYDTKPIYIEDLGIDHITIDEVHNYKNIFTSAKSNYKKGEAPEEVNPYGSISGSSSARGRKMFAAAQYILKNNGGRGVFSLSATPFNNQPIEVYNMLSLHAYNRLVEKGIQNINSFFDYFADFRNEWIANPLKKGGGEFGQVMKDFNNLPEMQRLIGEYIDYVGDNPNLVRPEKRMKKVILTPSDMQREIQQRLQKEEKRLNDKGDKDSVLPIYTDMRLNIISPYLTSYGKLEPTPTWEEFIESSPKLKFAVDTIKALRDEGQNDGVFIYMPLGVEYHSLLKEAIENMVGKDRVKVGIINGTTSGTETVDGEKVEKRIAIAEKFRKGELNVLIGGSNTSEGINLQDNGFITINTLIGWNPTEITQLNGRIHRQGNLRDHVIELLPLLTDGGDVMMMQKYDEKANRINNIFNAQGRTFNLEELDPEEEKMALNTDPVRKAELSIDMDKKRIQRDIQKSIIDLIIGTTVPSLSNTVEDGSSPSK